MSSERKLKKTKKYTIVLHEYDDGAFNMVRSNDGFSVVELLGILSLAQSDLLALFSQNVKDIPTERKSTSSPLIHPST